MNGEITAPEVRLVNPQGEPLGIVKLAEALGLAEEADLDLVMIAPQAEPPVCKLMDFGKFKYQEAKKAHEAKLKQKIVHIKEVKLRPSTGEGDYLVKLSSVKRFLEEGDKTKISLRFRGREITHQSLGAKMLQRLREDLEDVAVVEQMPKMEMRQMIMILSPKKKK